MDTANRNGKQCNRCSKGTVHPTAPSETSWAKQMEMGNNKATGAARHLAPDCAIRVLHKDSLESTVQTVKTKYWAECGCICTHNTEGAVLRQFSNFQTWQRILKHHDSTTPPIQASPERCQQNVAPKEKAQSVQ